MDDCYIVISTWGHPASWSKAKYRFNGKEYSSCCTLIPILGHLIIGECRDSENQVDPGKLEERASSIKRIYVLGLDSVIDERKSEERKSEKRSVCSEAFKSCKEKSLGSNVSLTEYSNLIEATEGIYKCVFEELIKADTCLQAYLSLLGSRARFIAVPAIGSPGGNLTFSGDPENYLSISLLRIGEDILRENDLSRCERIKVWFDSTHGINYMPVLTLRVSEIIAQVLRVRFGSEVEVEVFNSDPYPPGSSQGTVDLNINKTLAKRIIEVEIPRIPSNKWYDIYGEDICREEKTISKISESLEEPLGKDTKSGKDLKSKTLNVIASLYSPTPLALMYACYEFLCKHGGEALIKGYGDGDVAGEPCVDALSRLALVGDLWICFTKKNNKKFIRCLTLRSNAVWALLLAYATCRSLHEELAKSSGSVKRINGTIAFRFDFLKKTFMDDEKQLYTRIHSAHYYIIADELSRLSRSIEKAKEKGVIGKCIRYDELIESTGRSSSQQTNYSDKSREPNERILIAHAGLQSDLVEICIENDGVYVKYLNDDVVGKVFNHLRNVFSKK